MFKDEFQKKIFENFVALLIDIDDDGEGPLLPPFNLDAPGKVLEW